MGKTHTKQVLSTLSKNKLLRELGRISSLNQTKIKEGKKWEERGAPLELGMKEEEQIESCW